MDYIIINVASGRSSVWLERHLGVVEAAGSSPVAPTIIFILGNKNWGRGESSSLKKGIRGHGK